MSDPKPTTLITTYLEMQSRDQFVPAYSDHPDIRIEKLQRVDVEYYLFLYRTVGEQLTWRDRVLMPGEKLHSLLMQAHIYVLSLGGVPAGYVELEQQGTDVEIAYFGLREAYQGLGLGKHLLSFGIEAAWQLQPARVYVHTCNLDGPHAMSNYIKRGFTVYKREEEPMPPQYL